MKVVLDSKFIQKNNKKHDGMSFKSLRTTHISVLQKYVVKNKDFVEALKSRAISLKFDLNVPKAKLTQKFCQMFSEISSDLSAKARLQDAVSNINDENFEFLNMLDSKFHRFPIMEAFAKFSDAKTLPILKSFVTRDEFLYDKDENYIAKIDYLNFVANNFAKVDDIEKMHDLFFSIEAENLPLVKHLTKYFNNDIAKVHLQKNIMSNAITHSIEQKSRLSAINREDFDTNTFLQCISLIMLDRMSEDFDNVVFHDFINSDKSGEKLAEFRANLYKEFAKRKISKGETPINLILDYQEFIEKTAKFLKENGEDLNPLLLPYFINTVKPYNFEQVKKLCLKDCFIDNLEKRIDFIKLLSKDYDCSGYTELIENLYNQGLDEGFIYSLAKTYLSALAYLWENEKKEIIQKIVDLRKEIEAKPDKYINRFSDINADVICNFYSAELAKVLYVYDNSVIQELFQRRLNNVEAFLHSFTVQPRDLDLLKALTNCRSTEGKTLTNAEKLNLAGVVSVFNGVDKRKLEDMSFDGIVDLVAFKSDYFNELFYQARIFSTQIEDFSDEKIKTWDEKFLPLVAQAITKNFEAFQEIFKGSFSKNFMDYIHSKKSCYSTANLKTKQLFEEHGINYAKWLKPSKDNEVVVNIFNEKQNKIDVIIQDLMENIKLLRQSPLKTFFDRRYSKYINNDEFVIPLNISNSLENLDKFIKNMITQLEPAWKRALENLDKKESDSRIVEQAARTLTIKDHLEELKTRLLEFHDVPIEAEMNLRMKMWDRNPAKDLFQGTYSTCCIALDRSCADAMPEFILNTSFNMIEIVDEFSGKTIGNSLCYFALTDNGSPVFIVDNIEINNNYKFKDKSAHCILGALKQYINNLVKEVYGKEVPIYVGKTYNDLKEFAVTDYKKIEILGDIRSERIYLDLYGGWTTSNNSNKELNIFVL